MLSLPFVVVSRNPTPPPSAAIVARRSEAAGETLCYSACGSVVGPLELGALSRCDGKLFGVRTWLWRTRAPGAQRDDSSPGRDLAEHDRPKHDAQGK